MKYCDKFDAFGEALHEIFAGNTLFTKHGYDPRYGRLPIPPENYIPYVTEFPQRYPAMAALFRAGHKLLAPPQWIGFAGISRRGQPHTKETFSQPSGYLPYDAWKQVIVLSATPKEQAHYWTQQEFQMGER